MAVDRRSRQGAAVWWAVAALLLALTASLVLLFAPLGTQVEVTAMSPTGSSEQIGAPETKVTHPSLVETQGWSVAVPLSVPVVVVGAGVMAAWRRSRPLLILIAALLGVGIVLGALSIGVFYAPTEAAMIVAAVRERGT